MSLTSNTKIHQWYSFKEVEALVCNYAELKSAMDVRGPGLRVLLLLADVDRAIANMPPKEYHAILLHGQLSYTLRDAELVLGVSKSTLHDRFTSGINWLVDYLNGVAV